MRCRTLHLALLAATLSIACAGDPTAPAGPPPPVVTIRARDFTFDAPDTILAGATTFRFINQGTMLHHAAIFRLDGGHSTSEALAALALPPPRPGWLVPLGGPNAVNAGDSTEVTEVLSPGRYLLVCLLNIPGGVPHFSRGMSRALVATPDTAGAASLPAADLGITLRDYRFDLSAPVTAGEHRFRVRTAPGQPHELELVRLAPGRTVEDVFAYLAAPVPPPGPPPGVPLGGVVDLAAGFPVDFPAHLTPGRYALFCFARDQRDGQPHVAHGMVAELDVP